MLDRALFAIPRLILAYFLAGDGLQLRADEVKLNVRELCRLEVASKLLQSYNDIAILRDQVQLGEQKIKDFAAHIRLLENEYKKLEASPRGSIPVFELDEKVVVLKYQLQTLRAQQLETEQHLTSNKKRYEEEETKRIAFAKLLIPVFAFDFSSDDGKSGLPQKIRYHHVCSAYQLLCPLPPLQIKSLRKIAASLDNKTPCERYGSIAALR